MARWKSGIESINAVANKSKNSIEDFFEVKNYQPRNEEEEQVFEEFSLVVNSMAILIYIAKVDKMPNREEKEQIVNHITFQLQQRPYEFDRLSEKFGSSEKEIILNIYDEILKNYKANKLSLDDIIEDICLVYKNNPEKGYYLIRLSYFVALADHDLNKVEKDAIQSIADKMQISRDELKRIEKEVTLEVGRK